MRAAATGAIPAMTKQQCQDHFEDFYEDVFEECAKFGEVEATDFMGKAVEKEDPRLEKFVNSKINSLEIASPMYFT